MFGILPTFLENFICSTTSRTKTALGIFHLWFNSFVASCLQAVGIRFSTEVKQRGVPVVSAFSPVSFCMGMITPVCQFSVPLQNAMPLDTHEAAKELVCSRFWAFQVGFHRFFAIIRHTESFPSVYPISRWSCSGHSTFASAAHSGSSPHKDDTLTAKVSCTLVHHGLPLYSVGTPKPEDNRQKRAVELQYFTRERIIFEF